MFNKFIGVTAELAAAIEGYRKTPEQSECDILLGALRPPLAESKMTFDVGQGAELRVGERLFLFLSETTKLQGKPDGVADVRSDGLYVDGQRVIPSRGSVLGPAMVKWQQRRNHRNTDGKIVSLSAWRQWHVERGGKLVPILELKDPELARHRGRISPIDLTLEDLGL